MGKACPLKSCSTRASDSTIAVAATESPLRCRSANASHACTAYVWNLDTATGHLMKRAANNQATSSHDGAASSTACRHRACKVRPHHIIQRNVFHHQPPQLSRHLQAGRPRFRHGMRPMCIDRICLAPTSAPRFARAIFRAAAVPRCASRCAAPAEAKARAERIVLGTSRALTRRTEL